MALRRGTLERGRCRECGETDVIGLIEEPARWREAVWVCREHRQAELERLRDTAAQRAADAKQATRRVSLVGNCAYTNTACTGASSGAATKSTMSSFPKTPARRPQRADARRMIPALKP